MVSVLCGPSHSLMDFKVVAVSEDDYETWVTDMQDFDSEEVELDAIATEGQELFDSKSCLSCHATDNQEYQAGSLPIGPDLTSFADRSRFAGILLPTEENLVDWIVDPEAIKPGNKMTGAYDVTEEEAEKIAHYLMQLSPSDVTADSVDQEK